MATKGDFEVNLDSKQLSKLIQEKGEAAVNQLKTAIKDLASATYASITSQAQKKLQSTRQSYLQGLNFRNIGTDQYLISLDTPFANMVEDGWDPYNMKDRLLKSQKTVQVGSRAGQKWVQKGKKGQRYAHVPFEKQPFSKAAAGSADMMSALREFKVENQRGRKQKFTSIFKDDSGRPLEGKVATVKSSIPGLENVTKYQRIYKNEETGKQTTSSVYVSFKTISDLSPASKWQNKGYAGAKFFKEAERMVERELQNILKSFGIE